MRVIWKLGRKRSSPTGSSSETERKRRATAARVAQGTRAAVTRRATPPERLEIRRLMAADPIHVGVVYLETDYLETDQDVGSDSQGDRFILSFTGGAADTELTELRIRTDKDGDGISVGDPIYDTAAGGRGKRGSHDFRIVKTESSSGQSIEATADVQDGGQELVLRMSNFRAGDRLEFTLDVDEVLRNAIDLAIFNDRLDVITSGQEFQDSILEATFDAPHYETATADAVFVNDFGSPAETHGLDLPPDEGEHIDSKPDRSAAAVGSTTQKPKPISISGHVWLDQDLDLIRQDGEALIADVELTLFRQETDGQFRSTGHRVTTDADGRYSFPKSLGLSPGTYRIEQTQPAGLLSVGAVPGRVAGQASGAADGFNILTNIVIEKGDTAAVEYDFAEASPASISGHVYRDDSDDGVRQSGEPGIAGIRVQAVPLETIAPQAEVIVTTQADGSYQFLGLSPGRYRIVEIDQPADLADGIDAAGTVGGTVVGVAQNPGDQIDDITLGGGDVGIDYNFGEIPLGSLTGYVFLVAPGEDCTGVHDAAGNQPLPGVTVVLEDDRGQVVATTQSDQQGRYQFTELRKGEYRIREFTPSGLLDGMSHVGRIGNVRVGESVDGGLISAITLTAGATGTQYNFCEASPATLSGYVYHDGDDDGRRETGEEAIANVELRLVDDDGATVATTLTDADGRYRFTDVLPGRYTIAQQQPSGFLDGKDSVGTIDDRRNGSLGRDGDSLTGIVIKQGQSGVEYNFGELLAASLAGRVHVDTDGDCVIDPEEEMLAGVTIRLLDEAGQEVATTTTNDQGRYRFDDLIPGTYTIIEETPEGYFEGGATPGSVGGLADGPNRIAEVTLASGEVAVDYDFCERPPAVLTGQVFADADGDCLRDPGEVGIADVRIELYDDSGDLVAATTTDSSGNYRFSFLPTGQYTVREIQPMGWLQGGQRAGSGGGDDSVTDVISSIAVGWGDRLVQYNFCELEPSSLAGVVYVDHDGDCVRDDDEPPLENVQIDLLDESGRLVSTTTTAADGSYRFDGLAAGEYQIFEHQPEGYFQGGQTLGTGGGRIIGPDRMAVDLAAGQDLVGYDFCELAPASVSGFVWSDQDVDQVFDSGESPIPGVVIELLNDAGDPVATTRTDSRGHYHFDGLHPGDYAIRESQPPEFFHGGQVVGTLGGQVATDDWLTAIPLTSGRHGQNYNFPEVPPALIAGFVFQDGEDLILQSVPPAEELRQYRDGQLTADDTRLSGVTLELRNILGQPLDGDRALAGTYDDGPIRVTTNAEGYYEFAGLRPGTYHVYQVQPDDYIDALDTAGTAGGLPVNPADVISDPGDRIVVQTLSANEATDPRDDAILNIRLTAGQESLSNNFSEILIDPQLPPPLGQPEASVSRAVSPIQTFDRATRVVAYAAPYTLRTPASDAIEWAVSWHLSIINGGFPRGSESESVFRQVGYRKDDGGFDHEPRNRGSWMMSDGSGKLLLRDGVTLGEDNATAITGDFNGDGIDEVAIYVAGQWFIDLNGNGLWDQGDLWVQLGTKYDRPVVGDWDGDGKDDVGIFGREWERDADRVEVDPGLPDPANRRRTKVDLAKLAAARHEQLDEDEHQRWLRKGNEGRLRADTVDHVFRYGQQIDAPLVGDWNGDGIDQIAVFRAGRWLLDDDGDGRWTDENRAVKFGDVRDEPIVGDFNGDGIDEIGVIRGDVWIIDSDGDRQLTANDRRIPMPRPGRNSQPVIGDFDGDGRDEPGYYDEK